MALAALREDKTQGQIAGELAIHPLQVGQWKKQAAEGLPELFGRKPERDATAGEEHEQRLYAKIGELQTELDWLKKSLAHSIEQRRAMICLDEPLSIRRQCELLSLERSGIYHRPAGPDARELDLRARLDRIYTDHPFYGVRKMALELADEGAPANVKMGRRLLREMGLMGLYPKPRLSQPAAGAQVRPYLLRELAIERPHQVWAIDITCVPLKTGFGDLAAVLEWASRYVLAWELSNTLETSPCLRALHRCSPAHQPPYSPPPPRPWRWPERWPRFSTATRAASSPARSGSARWKATGCA